jgi:tetratricopeptide (TPR) repeat protein
LYPKNAISFYNLATYYSKLYVYEKAEAQYLKAIELDPSMSLAYTGLANLIMFHGSLTRAKEACENAIRADSLAAINYCNLGLVFFRLSEYAEAEKCYLKGIRIKIWGVSEKYVILEDKN